jgi:hypothetical protein
MKDLKLLMNGWCFDVSAFYSPLCFCLLLWHPVEIFLSVPPGLFIRDTVGSASATVCGLFQSRSRCENPKCPRVSYSTVLT